MTELDETIDAGTPDLYPPWKEALKAFTAAGHSYGEILTRADLERAFGMSPIEEDTQVTWAQAQRRNLEWLNNFTPFRAAVLETLQMDLVTDRSGGYIIIPPKEQAKRALRDMIAAVKRELRRGYDRIRHTNTALLTAQERAEMNDSIAHAARLLDLFRPRRKLPMEDD